MRCSGAISTAPWMKPRSAAPRSRSRGFRSLPPTAAPALKRRAFVGKLMRQVDFACQEADKSIFTVFTETDLRSAHVVARRIASVLKNAMLTADGKRGGVDTAVTLATLKPSDNIESLVARVAEEPPKS